jgi:hypothetical protein
VEPENSKTVNPLKFGLRILTNHQSIGKKIVGAESLHRERSPNSHTNIMHRSQAKKRLLARRANKY